MKKLTTDWRVAAGVLAAVILIFTPLGAKLSLQRAVDRVEGGLAIDEYMTDSMNAARNLITLGSSLGLDVETDTLRDYLQVCLDLGSDASVSERAAANRDLASGFEDLRSAIAGQELSERDAESLEIYTTSFEGPQAAIGREGYNGDVDKFISGTYNKFPTSLIGSLLGVDPPEYFN